MEIPCPHCGHVEPDVFELIEVDELHDDFVCGRCDKAFAVYIKNCIRCDFEQALAWHPHAAPEHVAALPCGQCGHVEVPPDALDGI
jgi:hypothetical protein